MVEISEREKKGENNTTGIAVLVSAVTTVLVLFIGLIALDRAEIIDLQPNDFEGPESGEAGDTEYRPQTREESVVTSVVDEARPAVVSIVATRETPEITEDERDFFEFFYPSLNLPEGGERQVGGGSGFFVSPDGLVVTNRHVVDNEALEYTVVTENGTQLEAEVIAKDPVYDVAVLKVDVDDVPNLQFADSSEIEVGQTVIAIGNALAEFSNTVTKGIVSGLSRSIIAGGAFGRTEHLENVIQTDAGINPGNSGGPLLNLNGDVIGVNVAVAQGSENIGFALPSNLVSEIVESVEENGEIVRPYLGVRYIELTENIAEQYDLSASEGALVVSGGLGEMAVVPDSPAAEAGIREGDIILQFNGTELNEENSLARLIRESEVGETVELLIMRNGEEVSLGAVLKRAPENLGE